MMNGNIVKTLTMNNDVQFKFSSFDTPDYLKNLVLESLGF